MEFAFEQLFIITVTYTWNAVLSQVSFTPKTAVLFPNDSVTFICNETSFRVWIINETDNLILNSELPNIDGVSSNGTKLIITQSLNNTLYGCAIVQSDGGFITDTGILYVATAPDQVPGVMVITDSITLNDENVTLTLSWGETFNNFDPIVSYTVSCLGDVTCPPDFTTTDNGTRSYTITNLTPVTNYTFSVVATNSIKSGEAGVVMIITPSLPDRVTGVMLMCEVMDQINQCTVQWDPITVDNGPLEQPLIYEVNYNGTMQNVTSPNTTLTFTAPSLPDEIFVGYVVVNVTAINRLGRGAASDPEYALIMSSSVTDVQVTAITPENVTNSTYSIAVNCTINSASIADMCEVMATANDQTLTGSVSVTNEMATVTIDGLACGVTYSIIAGGTLNGVLVGPKSSHGIITGPCPPLIITTTAATTSMAGPTDSDEDNTGIIIGAVVGGILTNVLIFVSMIIMYYQCKKYKKKRKPGNAPVAMSTIPAYDTVPDPAVPDKVKMESNPAYQVLTSDHDHTNKEHNPAYEVLASDLANKGPDPAYQDLSSYSGRASISKQKLAGDVNYYEDIINDQNITMSKNPSYAVP